MTNNSVFFLVGFKKKKKKTCLYFCLLLGLIELRGGTPLLDMLPDMFEWPIAVDNWEDNYGR